MLNIDKKVWEETEAKEFGEYERLELGGHTCIIRDASIYTSKDGNQSLKVEVDIASPDKQAGFFQRQFDNNNNSNKRWSNGATRYYSLKEEHLSMLKGLITSVENSNMGFKFNMDETTLKGKKIAGQFGLEEYEKEDGSIGTATKLVNIRSLNKLGEINVPKVKMLNGKYMDIDDYEEIKEESKSNPAEDIFGKANIEVSEDSLPFEI